LIGSAERGDSLRRCDGQRDGLDGCHDASHHLDRTQNGRIIRRGGYASQRERLIFFWSAILFWLAMCAMMLFASAVLLEGVRRGGAMFDGRGRTKTLHRPRHPPPQNEGFYDPWPQNTVLAMWLITRMRDR
jgi:hypothetical protein